MEDYEGLTINTIDTSSQSICKLLTKVLQAATETRSELRELRTMFESGHKQNKSNSHRFEELKTLLPLQSINAMENLERSIKSDAAKKDLFRQYIQSIGGNGYKDNINRIYKHVFSNSMACGCSWLGQKNNYRLVDKELIEIIKEVVLNSHNIQLKQFEFVSSEWFRHAKQRLLREK
ncbi:hypothetical protein ILUMI_21534 [Ignelater luminosus]|uniref:DUF4806 domain-containing protein n=1 Tax=Ignelater luminosus TaxID=2038154 RepID=A0A8K0CIL2_IGNLU|nr:hypothetical protein ILUMI_21534 [Ignelater luminosus]